MKLLAMALIGALSFAVDGHAGQLDISDGRIRETIPGQEVSAAYFTLANRGDTGCQLDSVSSPVAGRVEVHEHRHSGGTMQMRKVEGLTIAAGEEIVFEPGGYHLMLLELRQPLTRGDVAALSFDFGACGSRTAEFPVVRP